MQRESYIVSPDRVLFAIVAGAVLGLDQGREVEKEGGCGVAEKAQDVESGEGGCGTVGRAPADVEEGLGVE